MPAIAAPASQELAASSSGCTPGRSRSHAAGRDAAASRATSGAPRPPPWPPPPPPPPLRWQSQSAPPTANCRSLCKRRQRKEKIENNEEDEFSDEKLEKIEKEKTELLNKVLSGNLQTKHDKVGFILNNNTAARNSDVELAWSYWNNFEKILIIIKFLKKGFFKTDVDIIDSVLNKIIGTIKFNGWGNKAEINLNEKKYLLKSIGIWGNKWSLLENNEIIIDYKSSTLSGKIESEINDNIILLIGLYTMNYFKRTAVMISIFSLIIILSTI